MSAFVKAVAAVVALTAAAVLVQPDQRATVLRVGLFLVVVVAATALVVRATGRLPAPRRDPFEPRRAEPPEPALPPDLVAIDLDLRSVDAAASTDRRAPTRLRETVRELASARLRARHLDVDLDREPDAARVLLGPVLAPLVLDGRADDATAVVDALEAR